MKLNTPLRAPVFDGDCDDTSSPWDRGATAEPPTPRRGPHLLRLSSSAPCDARPPAGSPGPTPLCIFGPGGEYRYGYTPPLGSRLDVIAAIAVVVTVGVVVWGLG